MDRMFLAFGFLILAAVTSVTILIVRFRSGKGFGLNFVAVFLAQLLIPTAAALAIVDALKDHVAVIFSAVAGGIISLLSARYGGPDSG